MQYEHILMVYQNRVNCTTYHYQQINDDGGNHEKANYRLQIMFA